jgi:hypothetical protein
MQLQLLTLCATSVLVIAAPAAIERSFSVSTYRDIASEHTRSLLSHSRRLRGRQTAYIPTAIDEILYWYGNFTVGKSSGLGLLIDTGSSDLIVNPDLYVPSGYAAPYDGSNNFTISYEGVDRSGFGFETVICTQVCIDYADICIDQRHSAKRLRERWWT